MDQVLEGLRTFGAEQLPNLIVPIAILVVGWLVAVVLAAVTRGALRRTKLDDRITKRVIGAEKAKGVDSARWVGKLVYYVVLLVTVVAFLQALQLTAATQPIGTMLDTVFAFIPKLVGAGIILLVAWLVATMARKIMTTVLERWDIDRRIAREGREGQTGDASEAGEAAPGEKPAPVGRAIGNTTYWIVLLLFVPAILDALAIEGLLAPVQGMVDKVLAFLPNLASAALILAVGWFVARLVQHLVSNVLSGVGADRLSDRVGLSRALGKVSLSSLVGIVVYALILIPVAIGALNALQLESITAPASEMLATFFGALPMLFAAAVVLGIAYVAGRLLSSLARTLLRGIGFDNVLSKIGITAQPSEDYAPSRVIGALVMLAVMLFAVIEASRLLGFETIATLGGDIAELGGHILLGLAIFGVGMYFANLAAQAVRRSGVTQPRVLSIVTRVSILALAGAMALRQMGIADEIIEIAFGLVLGAAAVAAALAFGLGGREAAGRAIEDMRTRLQESRRETTPPPGSAEGTPEVAE